jgi:type II secretory pathway component GspD/PulD (secretin)
MVKKTVILWILMFFSVATASADELEMIQLRHRSADELLPVIRPLLDKDEVVTGMNDQLILRASARNIVQIRRLLESIDTLPRSLKITVMQNVDGDTAARLMEISGRLGSVESAQHGVHIVSTRTLEDDKKTQQLTVMEGHRARVSSGQSVPVEQRVQTPWGTQSTTRYQTVESGFYVLPRIHGERVTLEITAQNDAIAPDQNNSTYPVTRIQQAATTVSGRLGEWIDAGGTMVQNDTEGSGISMRSSSHRQAHSTVLIKVDEVN